ncbi:12144_t:CDS:2, partial [Gigaspora rosea]
LLNQPSPKYCLTQQYIKKQFDISTESLVDLQLESPTSVLSNSTYITDDRFVDKEETKKKIIITNYASGHNFENIIRKFLNSYNILANEIKVTQEEKDYIITNYKADEFNLEEFGITSKNVSIEQMVIKKNIVPRAITFAGTIGSGKTTCAKIFEKFLKDNVIDEINELEDHHYILIDRGFKEIEIFTDLIIKDEKSKECLKKQRDLIALKLQNDIIFVNPTKKKQLLKERKQETDFGKNVTKIIYQNYMINMKIIVAKYKKESPMLDYLFKQQAEKLQEEIKDIEEYECHKRIIKELIEGQDIDIVIVKYSIKFTHWAETIEGIKGIAEAIKNIKDNNKFKN